MSYSDHLSQGISSDPLLTVQHPFIFLFVNILQSYSVFRAKNFQLQFFIKVTSRVMEHETREKSIIGLSNFIHQFIKFRTLSGYIRFPTGGGHPPPQMHRGGRALGCPPSVKTKQSQKLSNAQRTLMICVVYSVSGGKHPAVSHNIFPFHATDQIFALPAAISHNRFISYATTLEPFKR